MFCPRSFGRAVMAADSSYSGSATDSESERASESRSGTGTVTVTPRTAAAAAGTDWPVKDAFSNCRRVGASEPQGILIPY